MRSTARFKIEAGGKNNNGQEEQLAVNRGDKPMLRRLTATIDIEY
jgi:hypothetical protein